MSSKRMATIATLAGGAALALGGTAVGATSLKLKADASGKLKFDKSSLSAKAGKVTITFSNPSSLPHSVSIRGKGVDADGKPGSVGKGKTAKVSATLKKGTYEFYCPVGQHAANGMKGKLVVR